MISPLVRSVAILALVLAAAGCGDDDPLGALNATLITVPANLTGLSSPAGGQVLYRVVVPTGRTSLNVSTSGGTGDVDVYVREGDPPTTETADCFSDGPGNTESCPISTPEAGDWYILLHTLTQFSGVTLAVTVTP